MKRSVVLLALVALFASCSFAQAQAQQGQSQSAPQVQVRKEGPQPRKRKNRVAPPTPKLEISASGSFNRYTAPTGYYVDMAGWNGSVDYNVWRWLGAQVEASGDYGRKAFFGNSSVYTLFVGPQFFPLRHHKFTPWAHFLFGEGYYRNSIPSFGGFRSQVNTDFKFAWEGGGGIDINFKEHWGIRFPQIDYIATRFFRTQPNQPTQADYRASIGIIYRIGARK